jgi:hypothetical protein
MGRKIYKVPTTELFRVELEGTFASSATGTSVENGDITTTGHQLNDINGFDTNGNAAAWNDGAWE